MGKRKAAAVFEDEITAADDVLELEGEIFGTPAEILHHADDI